MMKLTCKDIDPSSTCDYESTGNSASDVATDMMAHAKADHADKISGMSDMDIMTMLEAKVHN